MPHRTSRISFVLRQSSEEELLVLAKVWETCGTKSISDRWYVREENETRSRANLRSRAGSD